MTKTVSPKLSPERKNQKLLIDQLLSGDGKKSNDKERGENISGATITLPKVERRRRKLSSPRKNAESISFHDDGFAPQIPRRTNSSKMRHASNTNEDNGEPATIDSNGSTSIESTLKIRVDESVENLNNTSKHSSHSAFQKSTRASPDNEKKKKRKTEMCEKDEFSSRHEQNLKKKRLEESSVEKKELDENPHTSIGAESSTGVLRIGLKEVSNSQSSKKEHDNVFQKDHLLHSDEETKISNDFQTQDALEECDVNKKLCRNDVTPAETSNASVRGKEIHTLAANKNKDAEQINKNKILSLLNYRRVMIERIKQCKVAARTRLDCMEGDLKTVSPKTNKENRMEKNSLSTDKTLEDPGFLIKIDVREQFKKEEASDIAKHRKMVDKISQTKTKKSSSSLVGLIEAGNKQRTPHLRRSSSKKGITSSNEQSEKRLIRTTSSNMIKSTTIGGASASQQPNAVSNINHTGEELKHHADLTSSAFVSNHTSVPSSQQNNSYCSKSTNDVLICDANPKSSLDDLGRKLDDVVILPGSVKTHDTTNYCEDRLPRNNGHVKNVDDNKMCCQSMTDVESKNIFQQKKVRHRQQSNYHQTDILKKDALFTVDESNAQVHQQKHCVSNSNTSIGIKSTLELKVNTALSKEIVLMQKKRSSIIKDLHTLENEIGHKSSGYVISSNKNFSEPIVRPQDELKNTIMISTEAKLRPKRLPSRRKTQWDFLLKEMCWLASDFVEERKWKAANAKALSSIMVNQIEMKKKKAMQQSFLNSSLSEVECGSVRRFISPTASDIKLARKVASSISGSVIRFWKSLKSEVSFSSEFQNRYRKPLHLLNTEDHFVSSKLTSQRKTGGTKQYEHPRDQFKTDEGISMFDTRSGRIEEVTKSMRKIRMELDELTDVNLDKSFIEELCSLGIGLSSMQLKFVQFVDKIWKNKELCYENSQRETKASHNYQQWNGVILDGDDRSGKTVAACSTLWKYRGEGQQLLICSSLCMQRWRHELGNFPGLKLNEVGVEAGSRNENPTKFELGCGNIVLCDFSTLFHSAFGDMFDRLDDGCRSSTKSSISISLWTTVLIDMRYIYSSLELFRMSYAFSMSVNVQPIELSKIFWIKLLQHFKFAKTGKERKILVSSRSTIVRMENDLRIENDECGVKIKNNYFAGIFAFVSASSSCPIEYILSWAERVEKKDISIMSKQLRTLTKLLQNFQFCLGQESDKENNHVCCENSGSYDDQFFNWRIVRCKMNSRQRRVYKTCAFNARGSLCSLNWMSVSNVSFSAELILQLRRCCLHPDIASFAHTLPDKNNSFREKKLKKQQLKILNAPSRWILDKAYGNAAQPDVVFAQKMIDDSAKLHELLRILLVEAKVSALVEFNPSFSTLQSCSERVPIKKNSCKRKSENKSEIVLQNRDEKKKIIILASMPEARFAVHCFLLSCGIRHECLDSHSCYPCNSKVSFEESVIMGVERKNTPLFLSKWVQLQCAIARFNHSKPTVSTLRRTSNIILTSPWAISGSYGGLCAGTADIVLSIDDDWSGRNGKHIKKIMSNLQFASGKRHRNIETIKLICEDTCEETFFAGRPFPKFQNIAKADFEDDNENDFCLGNGSNGKKLNGKAKYGVLAFRDVCFSKVMHLSLNPGFFNEKRMLFLPLHERVGDEYNFLTTVKHSEELLDNTKCSRTPKRSKAMSNNDRVDDAFLKALFFSEENVNLLERRLSCLFKGAFSDVTFKTSQCYSSSPNAFFLYGWRGITFYGFEEYSARFRQHLLTTEANMELIRNRNSSNGTCFDFSRSHINLAKIWNKSGLGSVPAHQAMLLLTYHSSKSDVSAASSSDVVVDNTKSDYRNNVYCFSFSSFARHQFHKMKDGNSGLDFIINCPAFISEKVNVNTTKIPKIKSEDSTIKPVEEPPDLKVYEANANKNDIDEAILASTDLFDLTDDDFLSPSGMFSDIEDDMGQYMNNRDELESFDVEERTGSSDQKFKQTHSDPFDLNKFTETDLNAISNENTGILSVYELDESEEEKGLVPSNVESKTHDSSDNMNQNGVKGEASFVMEAHSRKTSLNSCSALLIDTVHFSTWRDSSEFEYSWFKQSENDVIEARQSNYSRIAIDSVILYVKKRKRNRPTLASSFPLEDLLDFNGKTTNSSKKQKKTAHACNGSVYMESSSSLNQIKCNASTQIVPDCRGKKESKSPIKSTVNLNMSKHRLSFLTTRKSLISHLNLTPKIQCSAKSQSSLVIHSKKACVCSESQFRLEEEQLDFMSMSSLRKEDLKHSFKLPSTNIGFLPGQQPYEGGSSIVGINLPLGVTISAVEDNFNMQPWTQNEDAFLIDAATRFKTNWNIISNTLSNVYFDREAMNAKFGNNLYVRSTLSRSARQCNERAIIIKSNSPSISTDISETEKLCKSYEINPIHPSNEESFITPYEIPRIFISASEKPRDSSRSMPRSSKTTCQRFVHLISASKKKQHSSIQIPGHVREELKASHVSHVEAVNEVVANSSSSKAEMWPLPLLDLADKERKTNFNESSNMRNLTYLQNQNNDLHSFERNVTVKGQSEGTPINPHASFQAIPVHNSNDQQFRQQALAIQKQQNVSHPGDSNNYAQTQQNHIPISSQSKTELVKQAARAAAFASPSHSKHAHNKNPGKMKDISSQQQTLPVTLALSNTQEYISSNNSIPGRNSTVPVNLPPQFAHINSHSNGGGTHTLNCNQVSPATIGMSPLRTSSKKSKEKM